MSNENSTSDPKKLLEENFVGVSLSRKWWGKKRKIDDDAVGVMADAVGAERQSITASKVIYNPKSSEALKKIMAVLGDVRDYWVKSTFNYTEDGVRLLPKASIEKFNAAMTEFQKQIQELAQSVQDSRQAIIDEARTRLGSAFNERNYPHNLAGQYMIEWTFPSLKPGNDLPPEIYAEQQKILSAKLEEAVSLGTAALMEEFQKMVSALGERLAPGEDGKKKVFRDSAVENLKGFFERFKKLNVGASGELDKLVQEAEALVSGKSAKELRSNDELRASVQEKLAQLDQKLGDLTIEAPRRKLVMPKKIVADEVKPDATVPSEPAAAWVEPNNDSWLPKTAAEPSEPSVV